MSKPIKPYLQSVTLVQLDVEGNAQELTISVDTGGNGHYARLKTDCWEVDVDELDQLVQTMRQLVSDADAVWGEPHSGESVTTDEVSNERR